MKGVNETTSSGRDHEEQFQSLIKLVVTLGLMTIPRVTANSPSFHCIIPDIKKKWNIVKLLILALCITDFCGCIGVLIHHVVIATRFTSTWICACVSFLTVFFPILSGSVATFMSAERCMALRAPYWYHKNMHTWKFWAQFATVVCLITVVCTFPLIGLGQIVNYQTTGNVTIARCQTFPLASAGTMRENVFSFTYGTIGLVMVVINLSLNSAVLVTVYKMNKRVYPISRIPPKFSQEFEITKMLLALSVTFLICWVPLNLRLVQVVLGADYIMAVDLITHILVGLNFVVDPLIYLIMKRNYRETMKALFCCRKPPKAVIPGVLRLTTVSTNTKDIIQGKRYYQGHI